MTDMIAKPTVQIGLAMTILIVVIFAAIWLLGRLRDYTTQDSQEPLGGLSNLEEMFRKGDINEEEFRSIQASARARFASSGSTETQPAHPDGPDSKSSNSEPAGSATPVDGEPRSDQSSTTS